MHCQAPPSLLRSSPTCPTARGNSSFLTPIETRLSEFLHETHQIVCSEPAILARIEEDLDLRAKRKKLLRLAGPQFLEGQTPDLSALEVKLRAPRLE